MDECPVLPATGSTVTVIFVAAAILVALGVTTLLMVRRRAMPMLAVVLVAGVVAIGVPAHAATGCPPPETAPTTAPTVAPTSTTTSTLPTTTSVAVAPSAPPTSTTTSSTTTSTTTPTTPTTPTTSTTAPPPQGQPPIANPDTVPGLPYNVLDNDDLGSPPATITESGFTTPVTCGGVSFDPATGVLFGTLPDEPCLLGYTIENSVGSDDAVALVLPAGV